MKDINDCLGLPLTVLETSEEVGTVTHFLTDPVHNQIIGLAASETWYAEKKVVLFGDIFVFGVDTVIALAGETVRPIPKIQEVQSFLDSSLEKRVRQAISDAGQILGTITDWSFDEKTAEVSRFRLEPTGGGEVWVQRPSVVRSSRKAVILDSNQVSIGGQVSADATGAGKAAAVGSAGRTGGLAVSAAPPGVRPEPVSAPPEAAVSPALPEFEINPEEELKAEAAPSVETQEAAVKPSPEDRLETTSEAIEREEIAASAAQEADLLEEPAELHVEEDQFEEDLEEVAALAGTEEALDFHSPPLPVEETAEDVVEADEVELASETEEPESAPVAAIPVEPEKSTAADPLAAPIGAGGVALGPGQLKDAINRNKDIIPSLIDKVADRDIVDDQDRVIIKQGQKITTETANAAYDVQKLYDLWIAAQAAPAGKN